MHRPVHGAVRVERRQIVLRAEVLRRRGRRGGTATVAPVDIMRVEWSSMLTGDILSEISHSLTKKIYFSTEGRIDV